MRIEVNRENWGTEVLGNQRGERCVLGFELEAQFPGFLKALMEVQCEDAAPETPRALEMELCYLSEDEVGQLPHSVDEVLTYLRTKLLAPVELSEEMRNRLKEFVGYSCPTEREGYSCSIFNVNDCGKPDEEKEALLKELYALRGHELVFVGDRITKE